MTCEWMLDLEVGSVIYNVFKNPMGKVYIQKPKETISG